MSDTPVLRRFSENNSIAQGVNQSALSMDDIAPVQHMTGDLEDKAMKLKQAVAVPQLIVTSFDSNRIGTATCLNFPSFEPVLGQPLDITFSAAYTAAGVPSVTFGGLTLQVKAQGTAVGKGFNILPATDAKRSFHATVKTTATVAGTASGQSQDKSTWYLDLDSNIVEVDVSSSGYVKYADGTIVYNKAKIDSLIAQKGYTITFAADGADPIEQTVYNTSVVAIGNIYLCTFEIVVATNTVNKPAYISVSSLNSNNYRSLGAVFNYGTREEYTLIANTNKTAWFVQNYDRVNASVLSGKRLKGYVILYPYSAPEAATLNEL